MKSILKRLLIFLLIIMILLGAILIYAWIMDGTTPKESNTNIKIIYYLLWGGLFIVISYVTKWILKGAPKRK